MMVNLITWMTLAVTTATLDQPSVWSIYRPPESTTARVLFASDSVLHQLAENPEFAPDWPETATADEKGNVNHENLRGGWAFCRYESDADMTVLLEGRGFHSIFVNGERFVGDVYRYGILRLPIRLKAGANHLLVKAGRRALVRR